MPDWETAAEVKTDVCKAFKGGEPIEAQVGGLTHKSEYMFRVVAVNKAGLGPESEPTDYHLVRHRSCESTTGIGIKFELTFRYYLVGKLGRILKQLF